MAELNEQQIYEALGVTDTSPAGEQERDVADSAPDTTPADADTGGQEREIADPAEADADDYDDTYTEEETEDTTGDEPGSEPGDNTDSTQPLTAEQRRANAARRRQQEQETAINDAVERATAAQRAQEEARLQDFFQSAQLKNSFTGAVITNIAEFNAWKAEYDRVRLEKELQTGKLTTEGLEQAISQSPAIKRAEEIIRQNEEEQQRRDKDAAQARVESELAEIKKHNPAIRTVEDILNMPTASKFYDYVRRGNSFADAYYLANREEIEANTVTTAKQQAQTLARSKDHLSTTAARGSGALSVPADELALYKVLNPTATEAQIQAYHNKVKK
jgi:hypothetical protein